MARIAWQVQTKVEWWWMILSRGKSQKLTKLGNITKKLRCLAFTTGTRQYFNNILVQKDSYYTEYDSWEKWRENIKNCKLQSSVINRWSWPIGGHMTVANDRLVFRTQIVTQCIHFKFSFSFIQYISLISTSPELRVLYYITELLFYKFLAV